MNKRKEHKTQPKERHQCLSAYFGVEIDDVARKHWIVVEIPQIQNGKLGNQNSSKQAKQKMI